MADSPVIRSFRGIHYHACAVPGCTELVECEGGLDTYEDADGFNRPYRPCEHGFHLCDDHVAAVACDYCGDFTMSVCAHPEATC